MNPKITALIPTYRRPHYLRRAILSVLQQTYTDLQVSIFDNASGDTTAEVVTKLGENDARIKYHCHQANIGSLKNFKYAFNSVTTPYFSVLSDDDFLAKDFYEQAITLLDNNPQIMFVIMDTLSVDKDGALRGARKSTHKLSFYCDDNRLDAFHAGDFPTTWTAMVFRREVAEIYTNMHDKYDIAADMRFLVIAVARYHFAYFSEVGAFFSYHDGSFSLARKNYDLTHYAVQISRYIEIIKHDEINNHVKKRAFFYMRKLLFAHQRQPWNPLLQGIKRAIKHHCSEKAIDEVDSTHDIRDAKEAGYTTTSFILHFFYHNQSIKKVVRILFFRYYSELKVKRNAVMFEWQNGRYKKQFSDVKNIIE